MVCTHGLTVCLLSKGTRQASSCTELRVATEAFSARLDTFEKKEKDTFVAGGLGGLLQ